MNTSLQRKTGIAVFNLRLLFFQSKVFTQIFSSIILLVMLAFQTYAQDDGWTLHSELDGVKAYYQISSCDSESVVFLKFVNSNQTDITVSWDEQMKFEGSDGFQKVNPMEITLIVAPGEVSGTTCEKSPILQLISRPNIMMATPAIEEGVAVASTETQHATPKVVTEFTFFNLKVTQD